MDVKKLIEQYNEVNEQFLQFQQIFDVAKTKQAIIEIESQFSDSAFWDDHQVASAKTKQLSSLKTKLNLYLELASLIEEAQISIVLLEEHDDKALYQDTDKSLVILNSKLQEFYSLILLNGKFDKNDIIFDIHAGAGGTEAQDWVEMLYRMYQRFFNKKGYKCKVVNYHAGDPVGIKSISLEVSGENVYGMLKSEQGVHRLIRISPFDSSGKRHTSFASVDVTPLLNDEVEIEINKADLKIDTYRASGAGGQSVNTTDSAVRITHIPTGIIVSCQNERSQLQNKEHALAMLKSKLILLEEETRQAMLDAQNKEKSEIGWGSQIRSYIFQPYVLVKDHRSNYEVGNLKAVLDGELDDFIIKYLEFIN